MEKDTLHSKTNADLEVTEADIWQELDLICTEDVMQPGDVTSTMMIERYGISPKRALNKMRQFAADNPVYEMLQLSNRMWVLRKR